MFTGVQPATTASIEATGDAQVRLHERARAVTLEQFGRRVFVRGVVEVSNFCREDCQYCGMRRSNRTLERYRARHEELAELLLHHRPAAITDINLQAGEDPVAAWEVALPLVRTLTRETSLGVSLCLGTLDRRFYAAAREAGASLYIVKFETADAARYRELLAPGTLAERLAAIEALAADGWAVSSGFIAGLPGQSATDLVRNCELAGTLPLAGCSVSPFVPGADTPLAQAAPGGADMTLNAMAALRLMRPDWLVPAVSALNLAQPGDGYRRGLRAGANLVTINLTPPDLRRDYLLYTRDRCIMDEARVLEALAAENLEPSPDSLVHYVQRATPRQPAPSTPAVPS